MTSATRTSVHKIIRVPIGFGAVGQRSFHVDELVTAQLWQPSGTSGSASSVAARAAPPRAPFRDPLMANPQPPSNLGRDNVFFEQLDGTQPTLFHRPEVSPWTHTSAHGPRHTLLDRSSR
jgi:hypothetical protein